MGKDYYAVGSLAERLGASQLVKPQKFIMAAPKICAAIGLAMQTLEISSDFTLSLSCVLPPAELGDAEITLKNVRAVIKNLEYPSGKVKIDLKDFNIYPEGYGILNAQALDLKEYDSIVTIMMGYRNISMFETKRGYPERPYTDLIGFYDYLFDIASETSIKVQDLIEPVCTVTQLTDEDSKYYRRELEIYNYRIDELKTKILEQEQIIREASLGEDEIAVMEQEELRRHLDYCQESLRERNLEISDSTRIYENRFHHLINCGGKERDYTNDKIKRVQLKKYKKYVQRLKDWFSERLPARTQVICIAGGTAKYLGDDIYSFLAQKGEVRKGIVIPFELDCNSEIKTRHEIKTSSDVRWHPDELKKMAPYKNQYSFPLAEDEKSMANQLERFEDIYGLFRYIQAVEK